MPAYDRNGREIPVHRLRENAAVWTPPSVIFFDTETRWKRKAGRELHTLRLWAGCHVDRRKVKPRQGPVTWGWGGPATELAEWVNARMVGRECVWMYAHNLGFDLMTSQLTDLLPQLGWSMTDFSVGHGKPWLRFGKGRKTLTLADSTGLLPTGLDAVAELVGKKKLALPANAAGIDKWMARCMTDVELLARAVLDLMQWWDAERLGRWTISGAGCGYNVMRHTASPQRHVIDPEPELVALDRAATRGGRKDATVYCNTTGGRYLELDIATAYPSVARELQLPVARAWTFDTLPLDSKWIASRAYGPIAEVTIKTDRPRYPVRLANVTWYPVGEFRTVLCGPEIKWARDNGDLVAVHAGQMHQLGIALRPWATWVLDPSRQGTVKVPPVAAVATKAWGRHVLGKFAARSHVTERLEGPAVPGWDSIDLWDERVGRRGSELVVGGRKYLVTYDGDTENCYPAVYAWVESEVRVRLGKVLDALEGCWLVADTDGCTVDMAKVRPFLAAHAPAGGPGPKYNRAAPERLCELLAPLVAPLTIRPKRRFDSIRVIGPQHTIAGDQRKLSGVRKDAVETRSDSFVGYDWPGLKWQIENSTAGTYSRPRRRSTFTAPTVHRWVLADGSTRPAELRIGADGANELVPWQESRWAATAGPLHERQYRLLTRLR